MKTYKVEDLTKTELIEYMRKRLSLPSQRELCFIMSERIRKKAKSVSGESQQMFDASFEKSNLDTFRHAESLQEKGWKLGGFTETFF